MIAGACAVAVVVAWPALAPWLAGAAVAGLAAGLVAVVRERRAAAQRVAVLETGRASAEAAAEELARTLACCRSKFESLFDDALEGKVHLDPEGTLLRANAEAARIFGCADAAALVVYYNQLPAGGCAAGESSGLSPGEGADAVPTRPLETLVRRALVEGGLRGIESEIRRVDSAMVWISQAIRPVFGEEGRLQFLEGTLCDITAAHSAQETLRQAKHETDLLSRAKSEFLANVSHELRTPLNAIIGFSSMIRDEVLGPIGSREYIEFSRDIHDSGQHLLALINDILEMAQVRTGNRELRESVVDIAKVVQDTHRLMRGRADQGQVELISNLPPTLPALWAEEHSLKQILGNLLGNAIKFTPAGGKVTTRARVEADGCLLLIVKDTGIGIAQEDLAKVLAPFGKVGAGFSDKSAGAGLGLPLTRYLIELHGGRFHLESRLSAGTTASIWFPADRVVASLR